MTHIKQQSQQERPRERLLQMGARSLSNSELLAIIIRCGRPNMSAIEIAHRLLQPYQGAIAPLFQLSAEQALRQKGIGPATYCQISAALELARRQLQETINTTKMACRSIMRTKDFLRASLRGYQHEVFACLYLDNQYRLQHYEELFHGSIKETVIYPREIIKKALAHNAAAVILAHNHPSGCATPSQADIQLTLKMQNILRYVHIELVDHIVIGDSDCHSMAEHGQLMATASEKNERSQKNQGQERQNQKHPGQERRNQKNYSQERQSQKNQSQEKQDKKNLNQEKRNQKNPKQHNCQQKKSARSPPLPP